jgi:molecular chaperone GrpE
VAGLQDEIASLNDRLLRTQAEMENMRKRAEREKIDTAKYAITKFATDVVSVGDNLGRALSVVGAEAIEADPTLKGLVDGVTMTDRALVAALERHGVKRIDPAGEIFNPHLHQAIAQVTDPRVPSGTIVQVHQDGYTIEDRVLRPAMVVVAQGGAKPSKPQAATAADGDGPPPAGQVEPGRAKPYIDEARRETGD